MHLLIDNYDSFTYNIFQTLSELTSEPVRVVRNDALTVGDIEAMAPSTIILSPGPGRPEEAGICVDVIRAFSGKIPILGVCLGHQAIGYAFGGVVKSASRIVHGKAEPIRLDGKGLFRAISSPSLFTRYHSLAVERETLPECLEETAVSMDGELMGIRHKEHLTEGIQFHPESLASDYGRMVLKNFLSYKRDPFELKSVLSQVIAGNRLSRVQAEDFMDELTEGNMTDVQIAGFLTALNAKGIHRDELAGAAAVLNRKAKKLSLSGPLLDTCGTGGDETGTFNISSMSALVAASAGARVAKHGNRAVSSRSGSADFFRELGIANDLPPAGVAGMIESEGFGFLFAPLYHGAMKFAAKARKELGIKTIMNLLGPLANPAGAEYRLIGVFADEFCLPMAEAAKELGVKKVMIVHSEDGLDELSVCAPSRVVYIDESGAVSDYSFDPGVAGIPRYRIEELKGGRPEENARIALAILGGKSPEAAEGPPPAKAGNGNGGFAAIRDAVLLNAGAALFVYGIGDSISQGYRIAKAAFDSGKTLEKLNDIRRYAALLQAGNGERKKG